MSETPQLIDIHQLSKIISRSIPAIRRDLAENKIPQGVRIGRSRRWLLSDVAKWITDGCPVPKQEGK